MIRRGVFPLLLVLLLAACNGGGEEVEPTPTPSPVVVLPSPTPEAAPTATAEPGSDPAFLTFAVEIDRALQERNLDFFRERARTEPVVCTPENTPPRYPGGPDCDTVGQQFDGIVMGRWGSEPIIVPLDEALARIESLWLDAVPDGSDEFGGSAPRVYAIGRGWKSETGHTAVLTALITRSADVEGSGPLRAVLPTGWTREGSGWRFGGLTIGAGEEHLRPGQAIWRDFQRVNCDLLLASGCEAQVANVDPQRLNVREDAGTEEEVIGKLLDGDTVCLLGSPALKDGIQWWPLRSAEGSEGWSAAFDPDEPDKPWLTATGRTCQGA